jgi:hypothetical protein
MKLSQTNLVRLGAAALCIVVIYAVVNSYSASKFMGEGMDGLEQGGLPPQGPLSNDQSYEAAANPHSEGGDLTSSMGQESRHPSGVQEYSHRVLTGADLLPKGGLGASWAATNPVGLGDLKGGNFLTSGYHAGINTIGTTLRNANLDLRSDPPNPRKSVSPFLNTTIEPDLYRSEFEIGERGCRTGGSA